MEEKEIWRAIKGYEGLYEVSNMGRIKSVERTARCGLNGGCYRTVSEKILKADISSNGYLLIGLSKGGKVNRYSIHRLVAEAFIPNIDNLPCINHIDENKENNCVENLEWVTYKENNNHGTHNEKLSEKLRGRKQSEESNKKRAEKLRGRKLSEETIRKRAEKQRNNPKLSKPVIAIHKINGLILEFPSLKEALRQTGISIGSIWECCQGKRKSAGGFYWMYAEEEN